MSVQIIDVRMAASGSGHEAQAWVGGPVKSAWVEVIENPGGAPYLRTRADGVLSDNLLSLPGAR